MVNVLSLIEALHVPTEAEQTGKPGIGCVVDILAMERGSPQDKRLVVVTDPVAFHQAEISGQAALVLNCTPLGWPTIDTLTKMGVVAIDPLTLEGEPGQFWQTTAARVGGVTASSS